MLFFYTQQMQRANEKFSLLTSSAAVSADCQLVVLLGHLEGRVFGKHGVVLVS